MSQALAPHNGHTILVVDDDRRVVELLNVALGAHGYRVVAATNGEDAVRVAVREQPVLVVLVVRLPRKSGLEVCEILRQDAEDPRVPIILVSGAVDADARIDGLTRGADDFLTKPFSPRELVARIRRLLQRSDEHRESRQRCRELESEVGRLQDDTRRLNQELGRELSVREVFTRLGRELHRTLADDAVARGFLSAVQNRLGVGTVALLRAEHERDPLRPVAVRGADAERMAGLALSPDDEFVQLVCGLARPVRRAELERFPEMQRDVGVLTAAGVVLLAPLLSPRGLEGLLLTDEKREGRDFSRADFDTLGVMCEAAAIALQGVAHLMQAHDAWLGLASSVVEADESRQDRVGFTDRVARRCEAMAAHLGLSAADRQCLRRAAWLDGFVGLLGARSARAGDTATTACVLDLPGLDEVAAVIGMPDDGQESPRSRRLVQIFRTARAWEGWRLDGQSRSRVIERLRQESDGAEPDVLDALLQSLEPHTDDPIRV